MGWKNIKEHYKIKHIVHIVGGNICIGSPYISKIIVFSSGCELIKRYDGKNEDLLRYQHEIEADLAKFEELFCTPDRFEKSVPIYTYRGSAIIQKMCESPEWPNCTHDGELIYVNTFFTDKSKAVESAKESAQAKIKSSERCLEEAENDVERFRALLAQDKIVFECLCDVYPDHEESES